MIFCRVDYGNPAERESRVIEQAGRALLGGISGAAGFPLVSSRAVHACKPSAARGLACSLSRGRRSSSELG
jgi:hypothetical protein